MYYISSTLLSLSVNTSKINIRYISGKKHSRLARSVQNHVSFVLQELNVTPPIQHLGYVRSFQDLTLPEDETISTRDGSVLQVCVLGDAQTQQRETTTTLPIVEIF